MGEIAVSSKNTQSTLTLWRHAGLVLLDIEPGISFDTLLQHPRLYTVRTQERSQRTRANLKLNVGLSWPEDNVVTLHHDKTTIGFNEEQLRYIEESPLAIASRLNRLLQTHLIIDDSIVETMSEAVERVV